MIVHGQQTTYFAWVGDNKVKVILMEKFLLEKIERIAGKEEPAGYQHFLHYPQSFQKAIDDH